MALPLVKLDAQSARGVWLIASIAAFVASIGALVRNEARHSRDLTIPIVLLMMLAPAVSTNLRIGQGYLLVFAMFTSATILLLRGRDRLAGIFLGMLLALKTSGVALVAILIARRRWTTLIVAALTAIALAIAITPFIDASMWLVYPSQVRAYVDRPASMVTAYQTTLGLFRHLCIADPKWNPAPAANCAAIA